MFFWLLLTAGLNEKGRGTYSHYSYNKEDNPYDYSTKQQLDRINKLWKEKQKEEKALENAKLDLEAYVPTEGDILAEIKMCPNPQDIKTDRIYSITKRIEQLNEEIRIWTRALE